MKSFTSDDSSTTNADNALVTSNNQWRNTSLVVRDRGGSHPRPAAAQGANVCLTTHGWSASGLITARFCSFTFRANEVEVLVDENNSWCAIG